MPYSFIGRFLFWIPERYFVGEIHGLEFIPPGPCVIASNHVNSIDAYCVGIPLVRRLNRYVHVFSALPRYLDPFMRFVGERWARVIYVDRNDKKKSIEKARAYLRKGGIVFSFIEGRVGLDPQRLGRGKTGPARLTILEHVPIIPCAVSNAPRIKGIRRSMRAVSRSGLKERVEFGAPMTFEEYYNQPITYEMLQEVTRKIMLRLSEMTGLRYEN